MSFSHRDRTTWLAELKAMREQEAREIRQREEAERLEREKPVRDAEAVLNATMRELRQRIATETDPDFYLDPATVGARMTRLQGKTYHEEEKEAFLASNPDYYPCAANLETLNAYFERNGAQIVSRKTLQAAYERLRSFGLLEERPAPEPQPTPEPETHLSPAPEPETYKGYDWETGESKTFTKKEVDRMTGDEYRRSFRIYKEHLQLPNRPAF